MWKYSKAVGRLQKVCHMGNSQTRFLRQNQRGSHHLTTTPNLIFLLCKADPEAAGAPLEAVPGVSTAEQMQTSVRTTEQKNSAVEL